MLSTDRYREATLAISPFEVDPLTEGEADVATSEISADVVQAGFANRLKKLLFHRPRCTVPVRPVGMDAQRSMLVLCALGLIGESGEVADVLLDGVRGRMDRERLVDEAGDVLWYLDRALLAVGATLDDALAANVAKLRARHPNGFDDSQSAVTNRSARDSCSYGDSATGRGQAGNDELGDGGEAVGGDETMS